MPASTPVVQLGGKFVLASSPVKWVLREGTSHVMESFDLSPTDADALVKNNKSPVTLVINVPGYTTVRFNGLFVLRRIPAENPNYARVVVADQRIFWKTAHVRRAYNMRRKVGVRRAEGTLERTLDPVVDDVQYAKYSLIDKQKTKWTARQVLEDVLKVVAVAGSPLISSAYEILPEVNFADALPIDDFPLDERADSALLKVLTHIPQAAVLIDPTGRIVVYDRVSRGEYAQLAKLSNIVVGRGNFEKADNSLLRPREIHVLATRTVEFVVEFTEATTSARLDQLVDPAQGSPVSRVSLEDTRFAENVAPVPDYSLTMAGAPGPVTEGTWVPIDALIQTYNALTPPGLNGISQQLLREAFVPFLNLWPGLLQQGERDPSADWLPRFAAIEQHWRRTFRINPKIMDNLLKILPFRVATIDNVSGQRAPATCWGDYCIVSNTRDFWKTRAAKMDRNYAMNVKSLPDSGIIDSTSRPSAARVSILDHDQGILHLDLLIDPLRFGEVMIPGLIEVIGSDYFDDGRPRKAGPSPDLRQRHSPVIWDGVTDPNTRVRLKAGYKVKIMLSGVPASPNSNDALERIVIRPADAILPKGMKLGECNGPIQELRLGEGIETARIKWSEDPAAKLEVSEALGLVDGTPNFTGMVVNLSEGTKTGGASLFTIAQAMASQVWAANADRLVGAMTSKMVDGIQPRGWMEEVSYEVTTKGEAFVGTSLPEQVQTFDWRLFLDDNTRAILFKFPDPKG